MQTLELIPTIELVRELCRRYDNVVFAGLTAKDPHINKRRVHWQGDVNHCVALTSQLHFQLVARLIDSLQDPDPEDKDPDDDASEPR